MKPPFTPLLFLCALVSLAHAVAEDAAVWKIELVPSRYSKTKGAVIYAKKPSDRFYIVLHNVSGKDQRVWRDWCSWGYGNLSMQAELEDGKVINLTKTAKKWGRDYPDASLVPAGKSFVFEVHLAGSTWQGAGSLPTGPFKLTVSYAVETSPEAGEKKVWVGKAVSAPITVTARR